VAFILWIFIWAILSKVNFKGDFLKSIDTQPAYSSNEMNFHAGFRKEN